MGKNSRLRIAPLPLNKRQALSVLLSQLHTRIEAAEQQGDMDTAAALDRRAGHVEGLLADLERRAGA